MVYLSGEHRTGYDQSVDLTAELKAMMAFCSLGGGVCLLFDVM